MEDFLRSLDLEQSVNWMIANDTAKVGLYANAFQPIATEIIKASEQDTNRQLDDYLTRAQGLRRSYELAPFLISHSVEDARSYQSEWNEQYDHVKRVFGKLFRQEQLQLLIPDDYATDPELSDKIVLSYIYFNVNLHKAVVAEIEQVTQLPHSEIVKKAVAYTAAALKNAFRNI